MTTNLHSDPREQAEAVALWCGWKPTTAPHVWSRPNGSYDRLPDYADDLNAMADVERLLAERGLLRRYREVLESMWRADDMGLDRAEFLIRLTALQRLAAAARVIEEVKHEG